MAAARRGRDDEARHHPGDQRSVLAKLAPLLQDGFYLVGGVAIAARLAHLFTRKYPVEDLGHIVRSLAYFGDATGPLPAGLTQERWEAIQRDFEVWIRELIRPAS